MSEPRQRFGGDRLREGPEPRDASADDHFLSSAAGTTAADVVGTNITALVGCGQRSGHVTATASWGPGGPFPISLNPGPANAFHTCTINASPGDDCYYMFDNNANGNGDFGFLNLAQWSWPTDQGCTAAGGANLLGGEITGTVPYSRYVFRIPDYVCQIGGLKERDRSQALASPEGRRARSRSTIQRGRPRSAGTSWGSRRSRSFRWTPT